MGGDLLITGGRVVDGSGAPATAHDVRVRNGTIVEIGRRLRRDGERRLELDGAHLTPGFVDSHTHFDASLFWDPACDPMPQHGVTTIVIGNCSLSLAPIPASQREVASETFASIEDIPLAAFHENVPWTWESYGEYVETMRGRRFGVNVVGLVGHSMLRLSVLGAEAWERPSTDEERRTLAAHLDAALAAGARGLSVSYFDRGADGRPVPSTLADDAELRELVAVLGRHGGHLEVIPMAVVGERDAAIGFLERVAGWCDHVGISMSWNAFLDIESDPDLSASFLALAHRLQAQGIQAFPQMSPRPLEMKIDFEQSMGFMYLPAWNELVHSDRGVKRVLVDDPAWRRRAAHEWDTTEQQFFPHRRLGRVRMTSVTDPALGEWVGRSLADWVGAHGGHPSDAVADWLRDNDFCPGLSYVIGNSDVARVGELCADDATLVSASDAGAHLRMFCASGDTTLLLTRHVRERGDLTLEAAVRELTSRQADVFGLERRGRIAPGYAADLVAFELDALRWGDEEIVADVPPDAQPRCRRPPGGYRATVVDGTPTQLDGALTGDLPGRWLPDPGA